MTASCHKPGRQMPLHIIYRTGILFMLLLFLPINASSAAESCGESHGSHSLWYDTGCTSDSACPASNTGVNDCSYDSNDPETYGYCWFGYAGDAVACAPYEQCSWAWQGNSYTEMGWTSSWVCTCTLDPACMQPCNAPSLNPPCKTEKIGDSVLNTISWPAVAGATQYQLEWCPADGSYDCQNKYTSDGYLTQSVLPYGSNPAQWAGGVIAGKTYNVRAKVNTASGCALPGAWSAPSTCFVENIDITPPVSLITSPANLASFPQSLSGFDVYVQDSDSGSGLQEGSCTYSVLDESSGWTKLNAFRECNTPLRITIEPGTGDCRSSVARDFYSCFVYVNSKDKVGNIGSGRREVRIAKESSTTTITSPANGASVSSDFVVSISDKFSRFAPSGNCYYYIYDSSAGYTRGSSASDRWVYRPCSSSFTVTRSSTGDCRTIGGTCIVFAFAVDNTGWRGLTDAKTYNIVSDTTPPITAITSPAAGSTFDSNFAVYTSDTDIGLSGLLSCYYDTYDSGEGYTLQGAGSNCSAFVVTVGPTGNCRTRGGTCTIYAYAKDNAQNMPAADAKAKMVYAIGQFKAEVKIPIVRGGGGGGGGGGGSSPAPGPAPGPILNPPLPLPASPPVAPAIPNPPAEPK